MGTHYKFRIKTNFQYAIVCPYKNVTLAILINAPCSILLPFYPHPNLTLSSIHILFLLFPSPQNTVYYPQNHLNQFSPQEILFWSTDLQQHKNRATIHCIMIEEFPYPCNCSRVAAARRRTRAGVFWCPVGEWLRYPPPPECLPEYYYHYVLNDSGMRITVGAQEDIMFSTPPWVDTISSLQIAVNVCRLPQLNCRRSFPFHRGPGICTIWT